MVMSEGKKKDVKMGLLGGTASGFLLFFAFFALTQNLYTIAFIPVAIFMGGAQAYIMPRKEI